LNKIENGFILKNQNVFIFKMFHLIWAIILTIKLYKSVVNVQKSTNYLNLFIFMLFNFIKFYSNSFKLIIIKCVNECFFKVLVQEPTYFIQRIYLF